MNNCKSIRKDDVNVAATQLGVEVGDKFIVLPWCEQYKGAGAAGQHVCLSEGDVVVLTCDDETEAPYFTNLATGEEDLAISFSRLARYEEKQEQEENNITNNVSLYNTKYYSAECADEFSINESFSTFEVKGLTPKQYSDILAFINNMK